METPRFSVSLCVYGGDNAEWFQAAVNSILSQIVRPEEIVLVVDGPVPETLDRVIMQYETDGALRVVRLPENEGHGNARRAGLSQCTNELVALMDADDISVPDRFEKQLRLFAADESLSVVGGNIAEFTDDPNAPWGKRIVPATDAEIKQYMKHRCPMNQATVMFKKSDVAGVGGYLDWYCNEDYYLWIRMAEAGKKFANAAEVLVNVRTNPDSYQRRGGWKYYQSEKKLQQYMRDKKIIGTGTYFGNVTKRFILQVLLPNRLREWAFRRFAREQMQEL